TLKSGPTAARGALREGQRDWGWEGQRCADEEGFDAVTLDEAGTMVFFKGSLVWKGFTGAAEPIRDSWPEIQGPVDAALRIHYHDHPEGLHDNVLLFQGKRVWAYREGRLRLGYPRLIDQEFPGIPADLDAAVECHPKECPSETIVFFQGPRVFSYDLRTKAVKQRAWPAIYNCTAAVRWLERYYCFQGIRFLRFNPLRGDVPPRYPLDARDYFMHCPGRGKPLQAAGKYAAEPGTGAWPAREGSGRTVAPGAGQGVVLGLSPGP
uniref:Hemopexin n=1 Tax=Pseudonaja textilis TaxID=8673 RepID=A0A670Z0H8_PSETE